MSNYTKCLPVLVGLVFGLCQSAAADHGFGMTDPRFDGGGFYQPRPQTPMPTRPFAVPPFGQTDRRFNDFDDHGRHEEHRNFGRNFGHDDFDDDRHHERHEDRRRFRNDFDDDDFDDDRHHDRRSPPGFPARGYQRGSAAPQYYGPQNYGYPQGGPGMSFYYRNY